MLRTDEFNVLSIEIRGAIAFVTLRGEDEMHRYPGAELNRELARLADDLRVEHELRALVVTGIGDIFSLGAIPAASTHGETLGPDLSRNTVRHFIQTFLDLDIPIITALNGPIMGGVLAFVLLSDIIVAEEHATIQDMHVTTGRPSSTGPFFWPPAVGLMQARRYLLTGDRVTAREAERIGLITEVVEAGRSLARATEYAEQLAALSPEAVGGTKRALNQWLKIAFPTVLDGSVAIQFLTMAQPDFSSTGTEARQAAELRWLRDEQDAAG